MVDGGLQLDMYSGQCLGSLVAEIVDTPEYAMHVGKKTGYQNQMIETF